MVPSNQTSANMQTAKGTVENELVAERESIKKEREALEQRLLDIENERQIAIAEQERVAAKAEQERAAAAERLELFERQRLERVRLESEAEAVKQANLAYEAAAAAVVAAANKVRLDTEIAEKAQASTAVNSEREASELETKLKEDAGRKIAELEAEIHAEREAEEAARAKERTLHEAEATVSMNSSFKDSLPISELQPLPHFVLKSRLLDAVPGLAAAGDKVFVNVCVCANPNIEQRVRSAGLGLALTINRGGSSAFILAASDAVKSDVHREETVLTFDVVLDKDTAFQSNSEAVELRDSLASQILTFVNTRAANCTCIDVSGFSFPKIKGAYKGNSERIPRLAVISPSVTAGLVEDSQRFESLLPQVPDMTRAELEGSLRSFLMDFYGRHNPSNRDAIDSNIVKFHGLESTMIIGLEKKYNLNIPIAIHRVAERLEQFAIARASKHETYAVAVTPLLVIKTKQPDGSKIFINVGVALKLEIVDSSSSGNSSSSISRLSSSSSTSSSKYSSAKLKERDQIVLASTAVATTFDRNNEECLAALVAVGAHVIAHIDKKADQAEVTLLRDLLCKMIITHMNTNYDCNLSLEYSLPKVKVISPFCAISFTLHFLHVLLIV